MSQRPFKENFINFVYFSVIFIAAFAISTLALYRKINAYSANNYNLSLSVMKKEAKVDSLISGRVQSLRIEEGQAIKAGDEIAYISPTNPEFAEETVDLNDEGLYVIVSPVEGTISEISITVGSSVRPEQPLVTIFSSEDTQLVALTNRDEYLKVQKRPEVVVYNERLQRSFDANYEGISKVTLKDGFWEEYEILFTVKDEDFSKALINGERMSVMPYQEEENNRPEQLIVNFWNKFLLGSK